eukprot:COSAG01_NODE_12_length_41732_cov_160.472964_21_plen_130_part_00
MSRGSVTGDMMRGSVRSGSNLPAGVQPRLGVTDPTAAVPLREPAAPVANLPAGTEFGRTSARNYARDPRPGVTDPTALREPVQVATTRPTIPPALAASQRTTEPDPEPVDPTPLPESTPPPKTEVGQRI